MTDFDLVWAQYPRKTNKQTARKAWAKLNPDTATVQAMIDALTWQTKTDQWRRGIIPHFSTWLNQARWEDEAPQGSQPRQMASGDDIELAKAIRRQQAEQATERAQTFRPAWEGKVH